MAFWLASLASWAKLRDQLKRCTPPSVAKRRAASLFIQAARSFVLTMITGIKNKRISAMKYRLKSLMVAAALALGFGVSGASASTVIMFGAHEGGGPSNTDPSAERGYITCSLGCDGWWLGDAVTWNGSAWSVPQSDGDWSPDKALMLVGPGSSDVASYIDWFDETLGFAAPAPVIKTNVGPDSHTFTTDAAYFTLSLGYEPRVALFRSYFQGNVISYTNTGTGSGLSHIVEYGTAAPIPLPAAGWLLLGGLGALAAVRRRRKAA